MSEQTLPPLIFGSMAHHGAGDDATRIALMQVAVDAGFSAFDTAPLYDFGASERRLGRALRGRDDVLVLSKVGLTWDDDHGDVLFATPSHTVRKDSRPASILREIDQSLERLGRDRIDVLHLHHPDTHVPIGETVDAVLEARGAGKVGEVGVSNFSPDQIRAAASALGDVPLFSVQDGYNLLERDAERVQLPVCRDLDCAFLAFSPLAQGVLAGKRRSGLSEGDWRASDPKFSPDNRAAISTAIEIMKRVAASHDASLSQTALAWLLAQPTVTSVIAGARTEAHVRANAGGATLALHPTDVAALSAAFDAVRLKDGRGTRGQARDLAKRGLRKLRGLFKRGE